MAVIAATKVGRFEVPGIGQYVVEVWDMTGNTGVGQAAEWIATSANEVLAAFFQPKGTVDVKIGVVINAQGTGVAEGTNPGDIGVQTDAAVDDGGFFLVLLRP